MNIYFFVGAALAAKSAANAAPIVTSYCPSYLVTVHKELSILDIHLVFYGNFAKRQAAQFQKVKLYLAQESALLLRF